MCNVLFIASLLPTYKLI